MTQDFENMLYLFGAGARGIEIKLDGKPNIESIRKLAIEQGIWTVIFPELDKICDVSKYQSEFFATVSSGIRRKEFTLGIIKKLEAAGIKCCLLKGAAVGGLYADPERRISSDTDILINPYDEEKLRQILTENGYTVEIRAKNDHHLKAYHKIGGLLEAHVMLHSKTTSQILFDGLEIYNEQWRKININGQEFYTLGINDGLIYLTAHYIKHLVNSGGGVRQMMDLLLYIEKNKAQIDFDRYSLLLEKLRYNKLIDIVKSIGAKYFGFDYKIENEALMNKILTDTEEGGIFGFSSDNRQNFYKKYCEVRTNMSKYHYILFFEMNKEQGFFDSLFPSADKLISEYGYKYAKNKILIPLAYVNRFADIIIRRIRNKGREQKNIASEERMKLMKDLGMI